MDFTYYYDEIKCENNEWLLFNILKGNVIRISDEIHTKKEFNALDTLKGEEIEILKDKGFLVESHENEVDEITNRLLKMKYNSENLTVTVLTNMDCNLGCKYCHENGMMDYKFLNDNQLSKINNWLTNQVKTRQYKNVTIYFYGGEPTLNMHAIEVVATHVDFLSKEYTFRYNFSMATNATLLNDDIVSRLKKVHVCDLQITLDGPRDVHDYRKPFLDGCGTFDIIINNVKKYYKDLNFTIRANVDKNNYDKIPELMDIVVENNLHKKSFFYLDLVSSTHERNEYCSNNVFTSMDEMASITYLWHEQVKRGIPLHGKNVIEGLCGNLSKSNVTISASGQFYICPGLCGIKDACLGDLDNGNNEIFDKMINTTVWENCKECRYFPMCAGGCRAQAYMKSSNCFACYCKKPYYEAVVMKYMKYKYEKNCENQRFK